LTSAGLDGVAAAGEPVLGLKPPRCADVVGVEERGGHERHVGRVDPGLPQRRAQLGHRGPAAPARVDEHVAAGSAHEHPVGGRVGARKRGSQAGSTRRPRYGRGVPASPADPRLWSLLSLIALVVAVVGFVTAGTSPGSASRRVGRLLRRGADPQAARARRG
jgi:hypothetical protein